MALVIGGTYLRNLIKGKGVLGFSINLSHLSHPIYVLQLSHQGSDREESKERERARDIMLIGCVL